MPEKTSLAKQPWFWWVIVTAAIAFTHRGPVALSSLSICVPLGLLALIAQAAIGAQRRRRAATERRETALADAARRLGFTPTRKFASISVDEVNQLWGFAAGDAWRIYRYADIVDSELIENGDQVQQGGASLGRAVVGGMLFGPLGAAVGSMTGAKRSNQTIHTLQVKVTVNDLSDPVVFIDMLPTKEIKANTPAYRMQFEDAQRVLSAFSVMQSQASRPVEAKDSVDNAVAK